MNRRDHPDPSADLDFSAAGILPSQLSLRDHQCRHLGQALASIGSSGQIGRAHV